MAKLSYDNKYLLHKKEKFSRKAIANAYKIKQHNVQYLVRLIDKQ